MSFGCRQEPVRDLTAGRPNCKSRSAPYHTPHGSRRATDRAPDGSLTETGRKIRRTLGVMTPAGVYAEDMPNGRRFKCDLSISTIVNLREGREGLQAGLYSLIGPQDDQAAGLILGPDPPLAFCHTSIRVVRCFLHPSPTYNIHVFAPLPPTCHSASALFEKAGGTYGYAKTTSNNEDNRENIPATLCSDNLARNQQFN
ncbi:hypothetical protein Bbelb_221370 [Branchiostoma belcheri]|nr:hypothetical protein Bbelb_221370 [Branchiostoma belcheri]